MDYFDLRRKRSSGGATTRNEEQADEERWTDRKFVVSNRKQWVEKIEEKAIV